MAVRRETYFCQIPEWVLYHPNLSPQAVRLYGVLDRYAGESRHAHPGLTALARKLGTAKSTAQKALSELKSVGAVQVTRRDTKFGDPDTNDYFLPNQPGDEATPTDEQVGGTTDSGDKGSTGQSVPKESHVEPEPIEPEKPLAPNGAKVRDLLFETVAEVCEIEWRNDELTNSARSSLNAAVKQLRDGPHPSPTEVRQRAGNWPNLFPQATLTPWALAKHWPQLARAPVRAGPRDRYAEIFEDLTGEDAFGGQEQADGGAGYENGRGLPP